MARPGAGHPRARGRAWGRGVAACAAALPACRAPRLGAVRQSPRPDVVEAAAGGHAAFLRVGSRPAAPPPKRRRSARAVEGAGAVVERQSGAVAVHPGEVLVWSWLPVCLVAAAAAVGPALPGPVADAVSVAMVGFIGVPHGATDHVLFERFTGTGAKGRSAFAMAYVAVMAVVASFIFFQPVLGVGVFLAASSYHWGLSHGDEFSPRLVFLGGAIVHQLSAWHAEDVLAICEVLAPGQGAQVATVFDAVGLSGTLGFGALVVRSLLEGSAEPESRGTLVKEVALLAAAAYLSARNGLLWSFAVYFSLGHAVEGWRQQFAEQQDVTDDFWKYYCQAVPFTLLCYAGGAGSLWLASGDASTTSMALAALLAGPVPHILLNEWIAPRLQGAAAAGGRRRGERQR